jgi:hypothetical protein
MNKPRIDVFNTPYTQGAALMRGDERLGIASRDTTPGYPVSYGVAIDNMGDPYRGVKDASINTPLGEVGYGYDGDTVGIGITPNARTNYYIQALANLLRGR